jgi:hypothetical protein
LAAEKREWKAHGRVKIIWQATIRDNKELANRHYAIEKDKKELQL